MLKAEGGVKTTLYDYIVCGLATPALDQKSREILATNQKINYHTSLRPSSSHILSRLEISMHAIRGHYGGFRLQ